MYRKPQITSRIIDKAEGILAYFRPCQSRANWSIVLDRQCYQGGGLAACTTLQDSDPTILSWITRAIRYYCKNDLTGDDQ